ncbi:MAG TPA: LytTR family DNA-binding domain-containing protein [Pyrinomonadaceae bacterium]|nr:LytTR family DNA-binding domain-containing protein [Pyrinomonadaceae bacterium]
MLTKAYKAQQRIYTVLAAVLIVCVLLTVIFDVLESRLESHSAFYLSESFLFSSFWWLFAPLIFGQFYFARAHRGKISNLLLVLSPISIHLFAYPALIWALSSALYQHTFPYRQTLEYELTRYGFILLIVYPASLVLYRLLEGEKTPVQPIVKETAHTQRPAFASSIVVADGSKRTVLETKDILYFSASPPYIYIHHKTKRYLHNETLKSVLAKLDSSLFVRVHRSTIVNISEVRSFRSRSNGDYDLSLSDGTELRLSRNFAADFKKKVQRGHQVTAE